MISEPYYKKTSLPAENFQSTRSWATSYMLCHVVQKKLEIRIIEAALSITGVYPMQNGNLYTLHGNILTFFMFIMLTGMMVELFCQQQELETILNRLAYIFLTVHAITKRMTLFQSRQTIRKFLEAINTSFEYDHQRVSSSPESGEQKIRILRNIRVGMLTLFGCGCISPFIQLAFGESVDMSIKLYPMYVPWHVSSLTVYVGTNLLMTTLLTSSLTTIYSTIVFVVFSMIHFGDEFRRVRAAIKNIEQKTSTDVERKLETVTDSKRIVFAKNSYEPQFKKCIQHYQEILRHIRLFSNWYNVFFTFELIEAVTTICLLVFSILHVRDVSLMVNLISTTCYVVVFLIFGCYIGEFIKEMNDGLSFELYDAAWYDQSKSVSKLSTIFQSQIQRPILFKGFNHFSSSYRTFSNVTRISYSYLNCMLAKS